MKTCISVKKLLWNAFWIEQAEQWAVIVLFNVQSLEYTSTFEAFFQVEVYLEHKVTEGSFLLLHI